MLKEAGVIGNYTLVFESTHNPQRLAREPSRFITEAGQDGFQSKISMLVITCISGNCPEINHLIFSILITCIIF